MTKSATITGTGSGTGTSASLLDAHCKLGVQCSVVELNEYGIKKREISGTCEGTMQNGSITCYCSAGGYDGNVNGVSHCTKEA